MDYVKLRNELDTDPLALGYAAHIAAGRLGDVEFLLNDSKYKMAKSRFVTARTVLAECLDGASILDKLESAAGTNSPVKWAMKFLVQDGGLDVGNPVTLGLISQLVAGGVLTAAEGDALKALADQPASRANIIGINEFVSTLHIARALGA